MYYIYGETAKGFLKRFFNQRKNLNPLKGKKKSKEVKYHGNERNNEKEREERF